MTHRPEDSGPTKLDLADRKMLAEITANVLGVPQQDHYIGRFKVLDQLGEGSMGIVFEAVDEQLKRRVAIKLLHQAVGASEQERKARLLREAQILAQLEHPNIVRVHEAGEHEGQVFMAMELVEGRPLQRLQAERPVGEWRSLLRIYVAAGHGLAAAHAKGVVHRDFKPQNVLVDDEGRVRVVDFGLARESERVDEQLTAEIPVAYDGAIERVAAHLTASGMVAGTPAYMAPELFEGKPASPASDQFSFCVALYEAVYGHRPFAGRNVQELVAAAKDGRLEPTEIRKVPKWLFAALVRGLAASPEARYPSMGVLLAELERDRTKRWKQAGLASAVAAMAVATWGAPAYVGSAVTRPERSFRAQDLRTDCSDLKNGLAARWHDVQERLARPSNGEEEVDGGIEMLDGDVQTFFQRMQTACLEDPRQEATGCRDDAKQGFVGILALGETKALPVHAIYELTKGLELCLDGEDPTIGDPSEAYPAQEALRAMRNAELAGDLNEALSLAETAIGAAMQVQDVRTQAHALLRKGAILEGRGDLGEAGLALEDALRHALDSDARKLAFDAAIELAEVEILHKGDHDIAIFNLNFADGLLRKYDWSIRRTLLLEKRGADFLYLRSDCTAAQQIFEQALTLRDEAIADRRERGLPTPTLERLAANAELNLANVEYYAHTMPSPLCKSDAESKRVAIAHHESARSRLVDALRNSTHPEVADFDFDRGALLLVLGYVPQAIEAFESALSIRVVRYGPNSLAVAETHHALAAAHGKLGESGWVSAIEHAKANIRIRLERSSDKLGLALAYDALGALFHDQDRLDDARENLVQALEILEDLVEQARGLNDAQQLCMTMFNLAMVELDRDDRKEFRRIAHRLREIQRVIDGIMQQEPKDPAHLRLVEAWVSIHEGNRAAAQEWLKDIELCEWLIELNKKRLTDARNAAESLN